MEVQERVRFDVQQNVRAQRSGMNDMFGSNADEIESRRLLERRQRNLGKAQAEVASFLSTKRQCVAHEAWAAAMVTPLVTVKDAKRILIDLVKTGLINVQLRERQRVPSADTIIQVV
jgi:hypothetical protein